MKKECRKRFTLTFKLQENIDYINGTDGESSDDGRRVAREIVSSSHAGGEAAYARV